jgi:hypothetical protein
MSFRSDSLADYLSNAIEKTASGLGIDTTFIRSSGTPLAPELRGQTRVIEICRKLGAADYYNAIGGVKLYSPGEFEKAGITLKFVKTGDIRYPQIFGSSKAADQFCPDLFGSSETADQFCPNLSIIDVLMNTGWEGTRKLLTHMNVYDARELTDQA